MFVRRHITRSSMVAAALFACVLAPTAIAQGTMQGPSDPGTVVSTAGPFVKPWTNPGNASTLDSVDATVTVTAPLQQTDFLDATNFGFSVAGDRVIRRIEVKVVGRANVLFSSVRAQLLKGGVPVGNAMNAFYPNTATDGTVTFNDQDDVPFSVPIVLWGTTWTPAQINAANFGVRLDFETLSGTPATFEVDNVQVAVYSFPMLPAAEAWSLVATATALIAIGALTLFRRQHRRRAA